MYPKHCRDHADSDYVYVEVDRKGAEFTGNEHSHEHSTSYISSDGEPRNLNSALTTWPYSQNETMTDRYSEMSTESIGRTLLVLAYKSRWQK